MKEQTIEKLKQMNLKAIAVAYSQQASSTQYQDLSFDDRFSMLVEDEYLRRSNNRLLSKKRKATLAVSSSLAEVDFTYNRGVTKAQLLNFDNCGWVSSSKNIIITGATGCGKTFIACALADSALKRHLKVKYLKTQELLIKMHQSKDQGKVEHLYKELNTFDLIIFDEWLRDNFNLDESRFILDLIDKRFRCKSCIFVSQLPIEKWHSRLGEPTIADAILDRIIHDSFKFNLKGESMRKITSDLVDKLEKKDN